MKPETHCAGCVFALETEGQQTGCELYRSEKLGVRDSEVGAFVLNRYCNTYRPEEWLSELSLDEYKKKTPISIDGSCS